MKMLVKLGSYFSCYICLRYEDDSLLEYSSVYSR
jgi:hypothetical protein